MKKLGQKVTMSDIALENYGEKYKGKILTISHVSSKYMPAKEFYAAGMPQGFHPGYDEGIHPQKLYDFKEIDFSLYDYELR